MHPIRKAKENNLFPLLYVHKRRDYFIRCSWCITTCAVQYYHGEKGEGKTPLIFPPSCFPSHRFLYTDRLSAHIHPYTGCRGSLFLLTAASASAPEGPLVLAVCGLGGVCGGLRGGPGSGGGTTGGGGGGGGLRREEEAEQAPPASQPAGEEEQASSQLQHIFCFIEAYVNRNWWGAQNFQHPSLIPGCTPAQGKLLPPLRLLFFAYCADFATSNICVC